MRSAPLTIIATLLLAGCIQVQVPQNTPTVTVPDETAVQTEEAADLDVEAMITGTGAIAERLLPNGILDIGDPDAPVTMLLFTEHHARYTRPFENDHFPQLLEEFIVPGTLRLQIAILPLKKFPNSQTAATGLLCAAMQNKGLPMHHTLSQRLEEERLAPEIYAEELGLDMKMFNECMTNEETARMLEQQKAWAGSLDVTLVPTFFLNGERHVGLPNYADLRGMIEELESRK
ncbi:MAG: thioredoxin domain-containing protein [Candidatus Peribacteraceae bacterium]|jgi:protein-disulfide isomerase